MPRNVPDSFKESLEILARFSDADMARVLTALREDDFLPSRKAVRSAFLEATGSASEHELGELAILAMAFARVRHDQKKKAKDTFAELAQGPNLNLEDDQRNVLRERLIEVSGIPGLMLASKASNEERNHERLVTHTDVETDLRPMLGNDGQPALVIPWHTLNLRFTSRQFDEDQSESVVMDHMDLVHLRDQIDEALEGRLKMQSDLASRGIRIWEPYDPADFKKVD